MDPIGQRINRLAMLQLAGFAGAAAALGYWQVLRGSELTARADNPRLAEARFRAPRGRILDRTGRVLAQSEPAKGGYLRRTFAHRGLGHVLGYSSPAQGATGLEATLDAVLSGREGLSGREAVWAALIREPAAPSDVVLTIDLELQQAAERALARPPVTPGAIVAVDPRSGAVRALATWPQLDPNRLQFDPSADSWESESARIAAYSRELLADPQLPLIHRPALGVYAPGSTFKAVTLLAALEAGAKPSDRFSYSLMPPDGTRRSAWHRNQYVTCQNHPQAPGFDLAHGFAYSCNVCFADLGARVGRDGWLGAARRLGFGEAPPFDLPTARSTLEERPDFFSGPEAAYALAASAMGQGELNVTPLQMALVASAIASGMGSVSAPWLVQELRRPSGEVVPVGGARRWKPGVSAEAARAARDVMVTSVNDGWASGVKIAGAQIGGKTGTAELGSDRAEPHAWFIGFATADNPRIALALIKERSGQSSAVAAPAARDVFEAALRIRW